MWWIVVLNHTVPQSACLCDPARGVLPARRHLSFALETLLEKCHQQTYFTRSGHRGEADPRFLLPYRNLSHYSRQPGVKWSQHVQAGRWCSLLSPKETFAALKTCCGSCMALQQAALIQRSQPVQRLAASTSKLILLARVLYPPIGGFEANQDTCHVGLQVPKSAWREARQKQADMGTCSDVQLRCLHLQNACLRPSALHDSSLQHSRGCMKQSL